MGRLDPWDVIIWRLVHCLAKEKKGPPGSWRTNNPGFLNSRQILVTDLLFLYFLNDRGSVSHSYSLEWRRRPRKNRIRPSSHSMNALESWLLKEERKDNASQLFNPLFMNAEETRRRSKVQHSSWREDQEGIVKKGNWRRASHSLTHHYDAKAFPFGESKICGSLLSRVTFFSWRSTSLMSFQRSQLQVHVSLIRKRSLVSQRSDEQPRC